MRTRKMRNRCRIRCARKAMRNTQQTANARAKLDANTCWLHSPENQRYSDKWLRRNVCVHCVRSVPMPCSCSLRVCNIFSKWSFAVVVINDNGRDDDDVGVVVVTAGGDDGGAAEYVRNKFRMRAREQAFLPFVVENTPAKRTILN